MNVQPQILRSIRSLLAPVSSPILVLLLLFAGGLVLIAHPALADTNGESAAPEITIIKNLIPPTDSGTFNLEVDGFAHATSVGDGGSVVVTLTSTGTHTVGESEADGTDLNSYNSFIECDDPVTGNSFQGPGVQLTVAVTDTSQLFCTITNTRKTGTIEVKKRVVPANDPGKFNLQINGQTEKEDAVDNDSTGAVTVPTGTYDVGETAGTDTDLDKYDASISCTANGSVGYSGSGTSLAGIIVNEDDAVICTITNTRKQGTIEVIKKTVPSGDTGVFNLLIDGTARINNVGNNGTTGPISVLPGLHSVGETQGVNTDLNNYTSAIACTVNGNPGPSGTGTSLPNITVNANDAVVCTITNTRKGTIEVVKKLVPTTDTGKFNLLIDGTPRATNVGHNGTTSAFTVLPGSHSVGETQGVNTDLNNYTSAIACTVNGNPGPSGSGTSLSSVTVNPGDSVVCTITNTRKGTIEVVKKLVPTTDTGKFNLLIDGTSRASNVGHNGTTNAFSVLPGSHSVGEAQGAGTKLANYTSTIACTVNGSPGPSGSGTSLSNITVNPGDKVICTITNTRGRGTLRVRKETDPIDDDGRFNLLIDGMPYAADVGHGGDTGAIPVDAGDYTVNETAQPGTDLANYGKWTRCVNATGDIVVVGAPFNLSVPVAPNQDVTCTITNTRREGSLEVVKVVQPAADPGKFNLLINNDALATNISTGGTTGEQSVRAGSHSVGETAGTGTSLDDYETAILCVRNGTTVAQSDDTGPLTIEVGRDQSVRCTITNTKRPSQLALTKTDNGITANPGDVVAYRLTYTNNGGGVAYNVVLRETVPANSRFDSASSSAGWNCTATTPGSACALSIGNVAGGGGSGTAIFAVRVDSSIPAGVTQIQNTARVGDAENASAAQASDTTPIDAAPGLSISKDDGGITAQPGDVISYTLTYANNGGLAAVGVRITETVPAYTRFRAPNSSAGWSCTDNADSGTECIFDVGVLAGISGSQRTIFAVQVASQLPADISEIENTALIGDSTTPAADQAIDFTPLNASPNLRLVKDDERTSVLPGDTIRYKLTYSNNGARAAVGVVIAETVPPNTTFVPAESSEGWTCVPNNSASSACTLAIGELTSMASGSATFAVRIDDPIAAGVSQILNTARIGDATNPNAASASDSTPVIAAPDLELTKNDDDVTVRPGETIRYSLTVRNTGNQGATGVTITETVPVSTTFAADASSTGWSCTSGAPAGSICTNNIGALAGDDSESIIFAVQVNAQRTAPNAIITNAAQVVDDGANGRDLTPDNNRAMETTPVASAVLVRATKRDRLSTDADGNGRVSPGDTISYTITLTNNGSAPAQSIVLTDSLDANVTIVPNSVRTSQGSISAGNSSGDRIVRVNLGMLNAGRTATVRFAVRINSPVPPSVTRVVNQAQIGGSNFPTLATDDPDTTAANDPTQTSLIVGPSLTVTKRDRLADDADKSGAPSAGDVIEYTVTILNDGNQAATAVQLADTPDANTALIPGSVVVDKGTVTTGNQPGDGRLVVFVDTIEGNGDGAIVGYRVRINDPLPREVTTVRNQGTVTATGNIKVDSDDPDTAAPNDATITSLSPQAQLRVTMTDVLLIDADEDNAVSAGDTLLYYVKIKNDGGSPARDVTFVNEPDPHTTLITGTVQTDLGTVRVGNSSTDSSSEIDIGDLPGGAEVTISFQVIVNQRLAVSQLQTSAIVQAGDAGDPITVVTNTPVVPNSASQVLLPLIAR